MVLCSRPTQRDTLAANGMVLRVTDRAIFCGRGRGDDDVYRELVYRHLFYDIIGSWGLRVRAIRL